MYFDSLDQLNYHYQINNGNHHFHDFCSSLCPILIQKHTMWRRRAMNIFNYTFNSGNYDPINLVYLWWNLLQFKWFLGIFLFITGYTIHTVFIAKLKAKSRENYDSTCQWSHDFEGAGWLCIVRTSPSKSNYESEKIFLFWHQKSRILICSWFGYWLCNTNRKKQMQAEKNICRLSWKFRDSIKKIGSK